MFSLMNLFLYEGQEVTLLVVHVYMRNTCSLNWPDFDGDLRDSTSPLVFP